MHGWSSRQGVVLTECTRAVSSGERRVDGVAGQRQRLLWSDKLSLALSRNERCRAVFLKAPDPQNQQHLGTC